MRSRSAARVYQIASRLWLTAAGVSLLLPARARLGYWLPLHLTVAGAVSTQISGAMQTFACALTATPDPPEAVVWAQFSLMTAGAGLLAFGYPTDHPAMVAAGGACLAAGAAVLGWIVWRAWRRALNRRHSLPVASYGAAVASVLLGAAFGALVGSGAVHGETWLALRRAHMTVNVLGWASLTIAGTLVTLLPTVLRVRMPAWHGGATGLLLAGGLSAAVAGLVSGLGPVVAVGTLAYAGGAAGLAWMVVRAARTPRRWPVPLAAKHLLAGVAWFVAGTGALAVATLRGIEGFDRFRQVFVVMLVGGWVVQTLLGAWLYLLPMSRPGHPEERRGALAATELAWPLQLAALNLGLVLMTARAAGWASDRVGLAGTALALFGGGLALAKAWLFGVLGRVEAIADRGRRAWGAWGA